MRKTYHLNIEGKNRDRLLDAAKHDIRKYVKRERAKALPEGADFWDFECTLGAGEATASGIHFVALMRAINVLVDEGCDGFFVSVLSKPAYRIAKPGVAAGEGPNFDHDIAGAIPAGPLDAIVTSN